MSIFELLFGTNETTTFYKLYNKLKDWKSANIFPYEYNLPKEISFPSDFWEKISKLQKQTLTDGNERAISIYWADGDLILSPVITGNDNSVTTRGGISVKYSQHPTRKEYARKEIFLNGSLYKKSDIYYKNIPKNVIVEYLFNMHTHPAHRNSDNTIYYNFFSAQDIRSLLSSNVSITGLITDKLWILIRTNQTPSNINNLEDKDVTIDNLKNNLHIGVYAGDFFKKIVKV